MNYALKAVASSHVCQFVTHLMQIVGLSVAVVFFALMRQAHAWDLEMPMPSLLSAVEYNLQMPFPFLHLAILPILFSLFLSLLMSQPYPPLISYTVVSVINYLLANGLVVIVMVVSHLIFYVGATVHVFIKTRLVGLCTSALPVMINCSMYHTIVTKLLV